MVRTKLKPKQSVDGTESATKRRSFSKSHPKCSSFLVFLPQQLSKQYYIGNIPLGITNNLLPEQWKECKVIFPPPEDTEYFVLKMFFDVNNVILVKISSFDSCVKDLFSSKLFAFQFYLDSEYLIAQLYIRHLPLDKFNASIGNVLKFVFANLFRTEHSMEEEDGSSEDSSESEDLVQFYKNIKEAREKRFVKLEAIEVQHPLLKPTLRPYQQEAIRWMLLREQFPKNKEMLHPLFEEIELDSGTVIYFNKYTGYVDNTKPIVNSLRTGGILADEMGLGKTIEVLACILLSPKPDDDSFNLSESLESPTVLIKSKKRKFEVVQDSTYIDKPKVLKLSNSWSKVSGRKSGLRACLNMWYDSKLQEVMVNKPKAVCDEEEVYCICGNTNMTKHAVQCIDCLKFQHGTCLGYKKGFGEYRCPNCWIDQPLLESKATLIVCPISLRSQWCDEICKHVSGLRIFEYEGSKATPIYPTELLDYDIVITTYSVLQSELRLTESTKVCNLRHARRYSAQGSPLSRIYWWRLCLDEAQMVEVPSSMMSTMAKKLSAQHRWAVTGTPITREISGLYGLIDYLQLEPYSERETWNHLLYLPYIHGKTDAMFNFLAQVMWRNSKQEVMDQIGVPPQTVMEYPLEFTAVESFFYQRAHNLSATDFKHNLRKAKIDKDAVLKSLDRVVFNFIMAPLLNIRQACVNAGSTKGRYLVTRKQVTSINDLLDALITKNLNFCEENLRMLVAALNGLAGLNLLANNAAGAVAHYRKVLRLASRFNAEDTKKGLAVDKLQLIHTMHNLAQVLETSPPVEPTLRDSTLKIECDQLQNKYLEKYVNDCLTTFEESERITAYIESAQEKFLLESGQWYAALMEWVSVNGLFTELVQRIFNAASNANISKLSRFSDERDLLYLIAVWDDEITKLREKSHALLSQLYTYEDGKLIITDELVQSAMNCHLRPEDASKRQKNTCLVCKVSKHMRKYEAKLFEMTQTEANDDEDISNKGSWKPTWAELVFKVLFALAKSRNSAKEIIHDGELYIGVLDAMKREFKKKRKFWTYLHQQINALDEINMCMVRITFKVPGQVKKETVTDKILKQLSTILTNRAELIHYIEPHELEYQASLLLNDEKTHNTELERNLGTYKYLETLRCKEYAGQNPDPCPICKSELQNHWSILPCGHSYCLECIATLINRVIIRENVTCSICRQVHHAKDISYIRTNAESAEDELRIKGDYSTKIDAIVKLVIKLQNEDNDVKILIFSTWIHILSIIEDALTLNDINCEVMFSNNCKNSVQNFKDPSKNVTAMLLPLHLGSKGLNLIEATHVILVEPLLNPGDELQAIGRVHRIGQTKPTTVHKFIIQNTIEENIHKAIAANSVTWGSNNYTVGQLIDLFITNEGDPIDVDEPRSEESEVSAVILM